MPRVSKEKRAEYDRTYRAKVMQDPIRRAKELEQRLMRGRRRKKTPEYMAKQKVAQEKFRKSAKYRDSYRRGYLKRTYGITPEDYDRMAAEQQGRCALCGVKAARLCVDHCHSSGRVRALLCDICNVTLGAMNDDPAILRAAAEYIEQHRSDTNAGAK